MNLNEEKRLNQLKQNIYQIAPPSRFQWLYKPFTSTSVICTNCKKSEKYNKDEITHMDVLLYFWKRRQHRMDHSHLYSPVFWTGLCSLGWPQSPAECGTSELPKNTWLILRSRIIIPRWPDSNIYWNGNFCKQFFSNSHLLAQIKNHPELHQANWLVYV